MSEPCEILIHCEHSRKDRNGNVYWLARFTNPITGDFVNASMYGGERNAVRLAAIARFGEKAARTNLVRAYCTEQEIPVREWQRREKVLISQELYEGSEVLAQRLHDLFHPAV